jgi:hypothetical protein
MKKNSSKNKGVTRMILKMRNSIDKLFLLSMVSLLFCIVGTQTLQAANNELSPQEREEGFVSLFNGKDLTGWVPMGNPDVFTVENGEIVLTPNQGFYLRTEKPYENFILRLEYNIAENANSGIFFHAPDYGRISRIGGEIQIFDSHGKELKTHSAGALYDVFPPKVDAAKPAGEWNALELSCDWPMLTVTLNGEMVQDINCDDDIRLRWRKRQGWLGIQDHGGKARFRNIRIKDLGGNESAEWTPLFNGADLSGWNIIGDAKWTVENGELIAADGNGYAITEKRY